MDAQTIIVGIVAVVAIIGMIFLFASARPHNDDGKKPNGEENRP